MVTLNISLPEPLVRVVDREVSGGSYASRSDFFRMLLRMYEVLSGKAALPLELVEFQNRPLKEIEDGFMATGKYEKKFVKGIISGLKREGLYAN